MMNARLNKVLFALLAVSVAGACDDPPIEPGSNDPDRLFVNPGYVVVDAGATRTVQAYLVNELGNPVAGSVTFEACNNLITAVSDEGQTIIDPGQNILVTGNTLGQSCINVSGAGFDGTIDVRVVPAHLLVTSAPDTVRAGAAGSIDVAAVAIDSSAVGPFSENDVVWTSPNTDRLFFTDSVGGFDTNEAGDVVVTATYTTFGVTRSADIGITILPAEPIAGGFTDPFPGAPLGDTVSTTVELTDSLGNLSDFMPDIDSVTVTSSNPAVATAYVEITEHPTADGRAVITIYAVGHAQGTADIIATAHTVNGPIALGTETVTVLSPTIATITPDNGAPGATVVITGAGLQAAGYTTGVVINGTDYTLNVTSVTPTTVTFVAPMLVTDGEFDVEVTVGGVESNSLTYEQNSRVDIYSPANEAPGTAPMIVAPGEIAGSTGGDNVDDFYQFTVATAGTYNFRLTTQGSKDLDMFVYNSAWSALACANTAATGSNPENVTGCALAPGTYGVYINDYSGDHGNPNFVSYHLEITRN